MGNDSLTVNYQLPSLLTLVVGQIVPAFLKELICKVLGPLVPLLALNQFEILPGELERGRVVSSVIGGILSIEARDMDIKLLLAPESNNTLAKFPGLMTHLDESISPEGFLLSILLLVVIIVAVVVIVVVTVVLVVIVVTVVLVVVVVGGSSIIKLSFVIIGSLHGIVLGYLIH
ncbi:hypothetical protein Tco_1516434 [Tanacetum coccineum]